MKVYGNFNMTGGAEIIEIVVDSGTSDPGSAVPGELYYRSDLGSLRFYNGSLWVATGSGAPGTVTSISATGSTGLVIGGSPITTSGTLTFTLGTELQALSALSTTGIVQRTGAATYSVANLTSGQVTTALGFTPGTVTSVSVTSTNGVSGSVATATTTPAITLTLGAITPTSVNASGTLTGSNFSGTHSGTSSGTNTGDQTITLTGDVTGSGTGSFATTLATVATAGTTGSTLLVPVITINAKGLVTSVTTAANPQGTVTSVAATGSTGLVVGSSPITSSGTLTFTLGSELQALSGLSTTGFVQRTGAATYSVANITSGQVTGALGFAPYNATNPSGYISSNQTITASGDASGSGTTAITLTLATVNTNVGTFGDSTHVGIFTVNAKGLVTAASSTAIVFPVTTFNTRTGAITLISSDVTTALGYTPGTGNGTVTSVSVVSANGVSGSVATATVTPAITLTLGAITPSSVAATGTVAGSNLSGTNTGDQTITLTGDVTGSGIGSFATTLASVGTPVTNLHVKITTDAKGRVTATSAVSSSDITTSLGYTPLNKAGDTINGSLTFSSGTATGLAAPTNASDAATKSYVDSVAAGLTPKAAVIAATTTNLSATASGSGVGKTLTNSGTQAAFAVDTITLTINQRVLVKNQTTTTNNGIYTVTTVGTGSTNWVLTRAVDFDGTPTTEVASGDTVFVETGSTQATTFWVLTTADPITVDTTGLTFVQYGGPGSYTAGAGLNLTGTVFSLPAVGSSGTYTSVTTDAFGRVSAGTNPGYITGNQTITLTGDITGSGTTAITGTLASVNGNVGAFGNATNVSTFTVNAKGLITAASNTAITFPVTTVFGRAGAVVAATNDYSFAQISGSLTASQLPAFTGDVTSPAGSSVNTLVTVNGNVGTFNYSTITVNAKGLITAASSNTPVTTLTGTASQVTVSAATGAVTLSLPGTINVNTSGTAAIATNTTITDNAGVSSATWYPTFVSAGSGNLPHTVDATVNLLTYVPSTGTLGTSNATITGNIAHTGGQSTAYWLSSDGTGRQHWYWNTTGGGSPTYLVGNEDAMDIMMTSNTGQGWVGNATFATTVMTVTATTSGTLSIGNLVTGAAASTYVVSLGTYNGSSGTGTVNVNTTNTIGSAIAVTGVPVTATFHATISGTTLAVGSVQSGAIQAGLFIAGTGVSAGTYIVSGSGVTWTVNNSQTVASSTVMAGVSGPSFNMRAAGGGNQVAGTALSFTNLMSLNSTGSAIITAALTISGSLTASSFTGSGAGLTGVVTSIAGTANQITASASTGAVTLSLPANITVPTPSSGQALTLNGASGSYVASLTGGSTSGSSYGLLIQAGTTALDFPLSIQNHALSNMFNITGLGNVTIAAPTSGTALFVTGVSGSNALTVSGASGSSALSVATSGVADVAFFGNAATTNRATINIYQTGGNNVILGLDGTQQILPNTTNGDFCIRNPQTIRLSANGYVNSQITLATAGNVTIAAPSSGAALNVTGPSGNWAGVFNGANAAGGIGLSIVGNFTGAGNTTLLSLTDVNNTNGANFVITGNGATTPNKYIRVQAGTLQILNSAYTQQLLTLSDAGAMSLPQANSSLTLATGSTAGTATFGNMLVQGDGTSGYVRTQNAGTMFLGANAINYWAINPAGALFNSTIPTTSTQALTITGANSAYALAVTGAAGSGTSFGALISGGTTSGDFAFKVTNQSIGSTFFTINGIGNATHLAPTSGTTLTITQQGLGTALTLGATGNTTNGTMSLAFDVSGNQYVQGLTINTAMTIGSFQTGTSLSLTTAGVNRLAINSTGNVVIGAPSSGIALSMTGFANSYAAQILGSATSGQSLGLIIKAGTTSADFALAVQNQASSTLMNINGAGNVTIAAPTSGATLTTTGSSGGNVIAATVTSGGVAYTSTTSAATALAFNATGAAATKLQAFQMGQAGQGFFVIYQAASASDFHLYNSTQASDTLSISSAGNWTIAAPSSGVALTVNAVSGTHSTKIADSANNSFNAGFLETPINGKTANYTLVLSDSAKTIYLTGSTAAQTVTVPANGSVAYPTGTTITIINDSTVTWTIPITTDTLVLGGTGSTGTRTIAPFGVATLVKVTATRWYITGLGVT